ncbi:hypothetical protein ACFX2I_006978 [Malus domestica]
MFSHFSLHLFAFRLYPSFLIPSKISSESSPFSPFFCYLESRLVLSLINACTSTFDHLDELGGFIKLSFSPLLFDFRTMSKFVTFCCGYACGGGAGCRAGRGSGAGCKGSSCD